MEILKTLLKTLVLPLIVGSAPTIILKISEPKVKFEYDLFQGPAVYEDSVFKKIVVVSFNNVGSQKLSGVFGEININKGNISAFSTSGTKILRPLINQDTNKVELTISSMLPSDSLSLSMLVMYNDESPIIDVSARSNEIIATEKENRDSVKYISLVCSLLTFIAVIMLELSIKRKLDKLEKKCVNIEKDREKTEMKFADAEKLANELKKTFDEMRQDDMLFYLSLLIRDEIITARLMRDEITSYPRMSDIIYQQYALNVDDVNYLSGQFCLLYLTIVVKAEGSQEIVKNNLLKMGWTASTMTFDENLFKNEKTDYLSIRNEFDRIFKLGVEEYIKTKQRNNV